MIVDYKVEIDFPPSDVEGGIFQLILNGASTYYITYQGVWMEISEYYEVVLLKTTVK